MHCLSCISIIALLKTFQFGGMGKNVRFTTEMKYSYTAALYQLYIMDGEYPTKFVGDIVFTHYLMLNNIHLDSS